MFIELDFPREIMEIGSQTGRVGRFLVRSWDELERHWKGKNGSGNVYFSAYGYRATKAPRHHRVDYDMPIIRHFIMDFDCKDFKRRGEDVEFAFMHEQVKRLHRYLLQQNYRHFIWFSGGGFHIWIPLSKTFTPTSTNGVRSIRKAGRKLVSEWHKKLDLGCNDPAVAFDTSGIIRIPNSYNSKRGCWMIPLETNEILNLTHDGLVELAQTPRSGYIEHGSIDVEIKVEKQKNHFKRTVEKIEGLPDVTLDDIIVLPCLAQSALGEGNPIHKARFHLVSYLAARFRWFYPPDAVNNDEKEKHVDRICNIIEAQGWADYDANITRHQVESIVMGSGGNNGYAASSCGSIRDDGLCVGECRYYDNTGEYE
tara:strand:+ start:1496 stop:2599 length:1104 start_codon:yes stop_codon:yes gene_type:complete